MKLKLVTLFFVLVTSIAKATVYYQPYPITYTQTTNGTDFRLELSVYDSTLAAIQTYNTPYYVNIYNPTSMNGIVVFTADNDLSVTTDNFYGYITYDFILHQWKSVIVNLAPLDASNPTININTNIVGITYDEWINSYRIFIYTYYDIISHNWVNVQQSGSDAGSYSIIYENVALISTGDATDNDNDFFAFNPAAHQWTYLSTVSPSPSSFVDDALAYSYAPFDPFDGNPPYLGVATLDPSNGSTNNLDIIDVGDFTINNGIYCALDNFNTEIKYGKYDAQLHLWQGAAFPSTSINTWKSNGGVISFINSTSTMVINAAYNFNLHTWVYDSVPTPSVSAHAITNGTVTWNNGSGTVTRGYSMTGGWSNSPTLPQAVFHLADLASVGAGNLVYVRNYSLGATTWSYNFGDGVVSTEKNLFHLFKVSGSYLYSGPLSVNVCLTVTSPLGTNSTCNSIGCTSPTASVTAGGPITFCTGGNVVLTANSGTGFSYQWQLNNANITGETNIAYTATAAGSYTCVVTNACGTATSNAVTVTISSAPTAVISGGPTTICSGGSVFFTANSGTAYQWNLNGSPISGASSQSYTATVAGNYTCDVQSSCGTATSNSIAVIVSVNPVATITASGPTAFCGSGTVTLSTVAVAGDTYQWYDDNTLISGATASSYTATSPGTYRCLVSNPCTNAFSNYITVSFDGPPNVTIVYNGSPNICTGGSVQLLYGYISGTTGQSFQWQLNGSDIPGATQSPYVASTSGSYTCVATNACGTATSGVIVVTVDPVPSASITAGGSTNLCTGGSVTLSAATVAGYSYQWKVNNVNIGGETNSSYVANAAGSYTCSVTNACGTATSNPINVTVNPAPSANITPGGPTTFCTGGNVVLTAATAAGYSYQWQLNNIDISGQTNSSYTATATGSYTCIVTTACGNAISNAISVTVNTGATPTINNLAGSTYLCPGNTYNFSVSTISGATFNWSVPANVTISTGQGSNAITIAVAAGFSSGSVCVNATNGCATSLTKCKGVATASPARPSSISGQLNGVCASTQSYTATSVSGATGYSWSVTGGVIQSGQGTQTVSVQWNSSGSVGVLNVAAVNGCGTGLVRSVGTTLKPAVASAIVPPSAVCANSTGNIFTIPATVGATTYTWQIVATGSSITSGQGTTAITANWGSAAGTVYCTPYNACGSSKTKSNSVTTTCRTGGNEVADINLFELMAYPNPFNSEIVVVFNSSDNSRVSLTVKDVTGRIVAKQTMPANTNYSIGKELSNGVYFIEALQNSIIKSAKIIKSR